MCSRLNVCDVHVPPTAPKLPHTFFLYIRSSRNCVQHLRRQADQECYSYLHLFLSRCCMGGSNYVKRQIGYCFSNSIDFRNWHTQLWLSLVHQTNGSANSTWMRFFLASVQQKPELGWLSPCSFCTWSTWIGPLHRSICPNQTLQHPKRQIWHKLNQLGRDWHGCILSSFLVHSSRSQKLNQRQTFAPAAEVIATSHTYI